MINPFTHRKILKKGRPGSATIVAMSMPEAGASSQNIAMTLQVQVEGLAPYEVEDQWMVNSKHTLGFGLTLPVKVDQDNPQKVAIDWDAADSQQAQETAARRAALAAQGPVGAAGGTAGPAGGIADPLAGAGAMSGMGAMGAMGAMGGAFGGGSPTEPVLDMRNDPELRHKIEKVIGRELTPGTSERLDFSSDPQMAAQVMQVIAQHQAEQQMRALSPQQATAPSSSSADDAIAQLERLDALRQSGALSQDEFDKQKKKLLG
jgi:hypothetical protein